MECSFAGQWCLSNSGSLSTVRTNINNPNSMNLSGSINSPNNINMSSGNNSSSINSNSNSSNISSSSSNASDNKQSYGYITSICHYNEYEVACGTTSGYIFIFDTRSNSLLYKWQGHDNTVFQILCWNKHSLITIGSDNLYHFFFFIYFPFCSFFIFCFFL